MTGGAGGKGGDSGQGGGSNHVAGGVGGNAGNAAGGGLYIQADASSKNTSMVSNATLDGNTVNGGFGGSGGQGENATGGKAGDALGGGLFNNTPSANPSPGSITLSNDTLAGNRVTGGAGGNAGAGTTGNGGNGGRGGDGGSGDGGGLYEGDSSTLTVVNSTFGGFALNGSNANSNIVAAGNGGAGGNGGTANKTLLNSNGGNGGNGGSVNGGGVWVNDGAANFTNDTIVNNVANLILTAFTEARARPAPAAPATAEARRVNSAQRRRGRRRLCLVRPLRTMSQYHY